MGLTVTVSKPQCPHAKGSAEGTHNGAHASVNVDWLVDTGADICSVWADVGAAFDSTSCSGLSASSTSGSGGFQVVQGITAVFEVEDRDGNTRTLRSSGYVAIKSGNTQSNLLGMQQLAAAGAEVRWDPARTTGMLLRTPGFGSAATARGAN
jgi:hypothetical protein